MATLTRNADLDNDAGKAYEVDGEIRLDQFAYELAQAEGWRKRSVLSLTGSGAARVLYVERADAKVQTVIDAAAAHTPNSEWTDPSPNTTDSGSDVAFTDVVAKVKNGEALTGAEMQAALTALVNDWDARQSSG